MKYRTLEALKCPYDGNYPLTLFPFKEVESVECGGPAHASSFTCRSFCHFRRRETIEEDACPVCNGRDVESGLLFCRECNRHYPVRDSIACMLPDAMRNTWEPDGAVLRSLPEEVASAIAASHPKPEKKDSEALNDRLSEMTKRDEESGIYDSLYPRNISLAEIETCLDALKPTPSDCILDAGCGTGRIAVEYLPLAGDTVGIDFSFHSLKFFRERLDPKWRGKIHLVQADISLLPLRDRFFDKAVSTSALSFLPTRNLRSRGLMEIWKTLKSDGLLVISVYNYSLLKRLLGFFRLSLAGKKEGCHSGGKIRYYNFERKEFHAFLSNGFCVLKTRGSDHRIPILSKIHPKVAVALDRFFSKTSLSIPLLAGEMTAICRKSQNPPPDFAPAAESADFWESLSEDGHRK